MDREVTCDLSPTPRDLIFSCAICQTTLSQRDRGNIRSSPPTAAYSSTDQPFWLAECAHITCSKHLDAKALVPHNLGNTVTAPCPLCSSERDDKRQKTLYAISGFQNGQYDRDIPSVWFDVPPLKLDSPGLGMEALRFQYLSLIRYGTMTGKRVRELEIRNGALLEINSHLGRDCDSSRQEIGSLKDRISELERCEKELRRWRAKEKMIVQHLKAVKNVVKENNYLRLQLSYLGYNVPKMDYFSEEDQGSDMKRGTEDRRNELIGTKIDPVEDDAWRHVVQDSDAKRKFTKIQDSRENGIKRRRRNSSRNMMPPPTSDDSLRRYGKELHDDKYVCLQKLEENLYSSRIGHDDLQNRNSNHFDAFKSIPSPNRVNMEYMPHTIRDSNFLKTDHLLPIEQYRHRTDRQPTNTRYLYPAYNKKQFKPCTPVPSSSRSLHSRAYRTFAGNGEDSMGTTIPYNDLELDGNGRMNNQRVTSDAAKSLYPNSAHEVQYSRANVRDVHVARQFSENQSVPQNGELARGSEKSFQQAELFPKIFNGPRYEKDFTVTSPFFKRKSRFSQSPDPGKAPYSHQAHKYPSTINLPHTQGHEHNYRGFDAQLIDHVREPTYRPEEKGRFERYFNHEMGIEEKRNGLDVLTRPRSDLLFSDHRSLSKAPYPTPTPVAPLKTPLTVPSAIPNRMSTRSVSSPVSPFIAFRRNSPAKRQYSSLQRNASQYSSRHVLPLSNGWPNTSYFGRRSIRR